MKNSNFKYILTFIVLVIIIGVIIYFYVSNNNQTFNKEQTNTESNVSRTSTEINVQTENTEAQTAPIETQISTYSTVIKDNASGRLTNIRITCGILNGTIINPGETFSFNNIVGKPTAERGYQEAKIIVDHKTETGIGGGNCQVSSTLYNAVLAIPTLTVKERHEHGKTVTYVPEGKDAAVSYGSLDFKFKNDNDYKIKIYLSTDDKNITASIFRVE
jgi:vancomycin resistance protein YoaR